MPKILLATKGQYWFKAILLKIRTPSQADIWRFHICTVFRKSVNFESIFEIFAISKFKFLKYCQWTLIQEIPEFQDYKIYNFKVEKQMWFCSLTYWNLTFP